MGSGASTSVKEFTLQYGLSDEEKDRFTEEFRKLENLGLSADQIHQAMIVMVESTKPGHSTVPNSSRTEGCERTRLPSISDRSNHALPKLSPSLKPPSGSVDSAENARKHKDDENHNYHRAQHDNHSHHRHGNHKRRSSFASPILLGSDSLTQCRCDLCDLNFADNVMYTRHVHFSKIHAEKVATAALVAAAATHHQLDKRGYQHAIDVVKLQNDVSRSTQLLSAYFQVNPRSPTHFGDKSELLHRSTKYMMRSESVGETVEILLYLLEDEDTIRSVPLHCAVIEILVMDTNKHDSKLLARSYVSYVAMVAMLGPEIRRELEEIKDNVKKRSKTINWTMPDSMLKKVRVDIIVDYIITRLEFDFTVRSSESRVVIRHDLTKLGEKLDMVLQKYMHDAHATDMETGRVAARFTEEILSSQANENGGHPRVHLPYLAPHLHYSSDLSPSARRMQLEMIDPTSLLGTVE